MRLGFLCLCVGVVAAGPAFADDAAEGVPRADQAEIAEAPLGASFGDEQRRADVLAFDPDGKNGRVYATGIRNCSGLTIQPSSGAVWCVVNERDGLGDDLPPDYGTRVAEGAFYGWPWLYLGDHQERHRGERPDLVGRVATPDVLFQPIRRRSASPSTRPGNFRPNTRATPS